MTEHEEKTRLIADHYGYASQSRQCMEECGELVQAINKYWRVELDCGKKIIVNKAPHNTFIYDNLIDELADVQIMIWQMSYLLSADTDKMIEQKLNRQLERIRLEKINGKNNND